MEGNRQDVTGNRLMAVFAHPDDEGQIAGLMAKYTSKRAEVGLVSHFRSQKIEAFRCHRSQLRPGDFRWMIMEGRLVELLAMERLVRVFPPVTGSGEIERDLFV